MNQTLEIVKATAADAELIVSLARKTFVDTYSELGIRNNMGRYMEEYFNVEKLADELARDDLHFYLAKLKDEAVGFTKLRNDRLPKGIVDKKCLEIERIYILKEHQGNSGGKELMNVIKKMARESPLPGDLVTDMDEERKGCSVLQEVGVRSVRNDGF